MMFLRVRQKTSKAASGFQYSLRRLLLSHQALQAAQVAMVQPAADQWRVHQPLQGALQAVGRAQMPTQCGNVEPGLQCGKVCST